MGVFAENWEAGLGFVNPVPETTIRKATLDDVRSLVALHCRAFADGGHAAMALGEGFIRALYKWQVSGANEFVLIAEQDKLLAGFVALSRGNYRRNMLRSCWPSAVKSFLTNPSPRVVKSLEHVLVRRPLDPGRTRAVHNSLPAPFELSYVVVDEHFRGSGVAARLLAAAEKEVAARGGRTIVVGVYKKNLPSRRAFTKAGWIESSALETQDTVTFLRQGIGNPGEVLQSRSQ
jgi:ribosomal protein S18 acetylase RimI-like enzyme